MFPLANEMDCPRVRHLARTFVVVLRNANVPTLPSKVEIDLLSTSPSQCCRICICSETGVVRAHA